jgi:TetR/AcrR family transcriptional regulator
MNADPETSGPEGTGGEPAADASTRGRGRLKPGERRVQILQTLAAMLQEPGGDRVTTAALAARLQVSEAALYRHFASKAQMFEGLIAFIEQSVFGLINQIVGQESDPLKQLRSIVLMLLGFADRNPGMTRVLVGDALVTEDDRLQARINQLVDRIEASLKQCFRNAIEQGRLPPENDPAARANLVLSFVLGRWLRFAKTGFRRAPAEGLEHQVLLLIT